jgi:hypothetical protein
MTMFIEKPRVVSRQAADRRSLKEAGRLPGRPDAVRSSARQGGPSMPQPTVFPPRASRNGTAQIQLVRRYARLLRETNAAKRSTPDGTAARKIVAAGS